MFDLKNIRTEADQSPEHYLIKDEGLKKAVNMAIWLQKPLLLTGAPGTGKTQLASKVAYELAQFKQDQLKGFASFANKPFEFNTKTTSTASDLFYNYDAVGHFQKRFIAEQQNKADVKPIEQKDDISSTAAHPYLQLNALGLAILQTHGKKAILASPALKELSHLANFDKLKDEPGSSVVLIDEIDKAPRDFPNDLLNEIEHYHFTITEIAKKVERADPKVSKARIVVIMTSNFEKNLPDAFLRRCLFYHIPSPGPDDLFDIVCSRMEPYLGIIHGQQNGDVKALFTTLKPRIRKAVDEFERLRKTMNDKQPATSELLEWIKVLEAEQFFNDEVDFTKLTDSQKTILKYTLPIIAKSKDDLQRSANA